MQVFAAPNATAHASDVFTATFSSASAVYRGIIAIVISGAATSAIIDTTTSGTQANATSITSPSFTPSGTGMISVVFAGRDVSPSSAFSAGTNYTLRNKLSDGSDRGLMLETRESAPASSQTATATAAGASWWGIIVSVVKGAAGTAGTPCGGQGASLLR